MGPLIGAGFAGVEIGSITPQPQPGNPKPRVFRLVEDKAIINRYGFNSDGAAAVATRMAEYRSHDTPDGVIGINLGKNKEGDAINDYSTGVTVFAPFADYLVVNVSSPNTPGLRSLQARRQLTELLLSVIHTRDSIPWGEKTSISLPPGTPVTLDAATASRRADLITRCPRGPPVLVKIAPDLSEEELEDIVSAAIEARVDGVIVTNTTIARPHTLKSEHKGETGGLSGVPLMQPSTDVLKKVFNLSKGRLIIVGMGLHTGHVHVWHVYVCYLGIHYRCGWRGIGPGCIYKDESRRLCRAIILCTSIPRYVRTMPVPPSHLVPPAHVVVCYGCICTSAGITMVPSMRVELSRLAQAEGYKNIQEAVGVDARRAALQ
jgi:dihydroorotate dehydrogenase